MNSTQRQASRWAEFILLLVAAVVLFYSGAAWWQIRLADAASIGMENKLLVSPPTTPAQVTADASNNSDVIGRIQIPDLHLSAPITDGIGKLELIRGVGHIPGTAVAGGLGTMALAGHRDTFFRGLRNVAPGMQIRVSGETGSYKYQVDSTRIVTPEDVEVLEIGRDPSLVLITCYPFRYIGAAPKRFIVHAKLLSVAPGNREPG